ncbi:hypothetical protein [Syntrophorhabdus aromaticivorans]|uniref:hypothetical protein n=1 Tax=Syntrophorhabdus aromaticivorans TaxID=328301 RepID=UPI0003F7289A|nr:hypothetical protein [Syntrophorhabdus aromaticivorans]
MSKQAPGCDRAVKQGGSKNGERENLRRFSGASDAIVRVTFGSPKTTGEMENMGKFVGVCKRLRIH